MPVTRTLFLLVATVAAVVIIGSSACTRRGGNTGPIPSTMSPPPTTYYVDPVKGNDHNNGTSPGTPFKTLTHALAFLASSKVSGLTISLKAGAYSVKSGEVFPIAVPTGLVITGNGYGRGQERGTFINGAGEDKNLEKVLGLPPKSRYATIVVNATGQSVSFDQLYIGAAGLVPPTKTVYSSVDDLTGLNATHDSFAAGTFGPQIGGVTVPSASLSCTGCTIMGGFYAIAAFSLGSGNPPSITFANTERGLVGGGIGILTDGTASINAANQVFASKVYAYADLLAPVASPSPSPSTTPDLVPHATASPSPSASPSIGPTSVPSTVVDFGYGPNQSSGGNSLVGLSAKSEIYVTAPSSTIFAYGNTWNAGYQGATSHGQYEHHHVFRAGATGKNVRISSNASGSVVLVGPPPVTPTPSPTPSPYGSSSPSPSPSPT